MIGSWSGFISRVGGNRPTRHGGRFTNARFGNMPPWSIHKDTLTIPARISCVKISVIISLFPLCPIDEPTPKMSSTDRGMVATSERFGGKLMFHVKHTRAFVGDDRCVIARVEARRAYSEGNLISLLSITFSHTIIPYSIARTTAAIILLVPCVYRYRTVDIHCLENPRRKEEEKNPSHTW